MTYIYFSVSKKMIFIVHPARQVVYFCKKRKMYHDADT